MMTMMMMIRWHAGRTCDSEHDSDRLGGCDVADVTRVVARIACVHRADHQMTTLSDLDATSRFYYTSARTLPPGQTTLVTYQQAPGLRKNCAPATEWRKATSCLNVCIFCAVF